MLASMVCSIQYLANKKISSLCLVVTCLFLVNVFVNVVSAQNFSVSVDVHQDDIWQVEPALTVSNVNFENDIFPAKMDFRVAFADYERLELSAHLRSNLAFGPLGNVRLLAKTELDTSGRYDVAISGEGVAASAGALRLSAAVYNVNLGHFKALDFYQNPIRPRFLFSADQPSNVVELGVGGLYRFNRTTVLELDPHFSWIDGQFGIYGSTAIVLRRLIDTDDIAIRLQGASLPAEHLIQVDSEDADYSVDYSANADYNESYLALGVEYKLNRRTLPSLRSSLWLGFQTDNGELLFAPGVNVAMSQSLRELPLNYSIAVALEPYRIDGLKYHGHVEIEYDIDDASSMGVSVARAPWGELTNSILITTTYNNSF